MAVGAAAVSSYVRGLDEALADRFEGYRTHLDTLPLAPATRSGTAHARDYTVRDYRTHLIADRKAKPASVNLTLAARDSFYRWVGLGPARARRDDLPQAAPRAVVTLLLFGGLRIGELAALDLGDVAVSARKGLVTVRRLAQHADLEASAHTLRHTCLTARSRRQRHRPRRRTRRPRSPGDHPPQCPATPTVRPPSPSTTDRGDPHGP